MGRLTEFFAPLVQLQKDMGRLFDPTAAAGLAPAAAAAYPALNAWETADAAFIEAELPGMAMGDVEILATGRELTISGARKVAEPKDARWHRRERPDGSFSRTIALPWDIDPDKIAASLRDGVLTVTVPKAESSKAKKIKVQTA